MLGWGAESAERLKGGTAEELFGGAAVALNSGTAERLSSWLAGLRSCWAAGVRNGSGLSPIAGVRNCGAAGGIHKGQPRFCSSRARRILMTPPMSLATVSAFSSSPSNVFLPINPWALAKAIWVRDSDKEPLAT